MRTYDELESLYAAAAATDPEPRDAGTVRLVCVRKGKGLHETPTQVAVTVERGVEGDRWFADAERKVGQQVTLMSARVAALIAGDAIPLHMAGDNFLVDLDLSVAALPVGTRVRIGSALLEITAEPHHGCRKFNTRYGVEALQWINHRKHDARRLRGVNCRVLADGGVAVGDAVRVER